MHFPCCHQVHECFHSTNECRQPLKTNRLLKVQEDLAGSCAGCCNGHHSSVHPTHLPKSGFFSYQNVCEFTNSQSLTSHSHGCQINDIYENSFNSSHCASRRSCVCHSNHSSSACINYNTRIIAPHLEVQHPLCQKINRGSKISTNFQNSCSNSCNVSSSRSTEECCSSRPSLHSTAKRRTSNNERNAISRNQNLSLISEREILMCGWYYGKVSWREAEIKLKECDVGTFLLRDSSDPRYKYSLSVQTHKGPTSVRIVRDYRGFSLDSDPGSRALIFPSVHDLVQHYVSMTPAQQPAASPYSRSAVVPGEHVWLDSSGSVVDSIKLIKPALQNPPPLKHLIRLLINKNKDFLDLTTLPLSLQHYVEKYPFWC